MSSYVKEKNEFLEELNEKISLKNLDNFICAVNLGSSYPYLTIPLNKDIIRQVHFYLENNVTLILLPFYYEGEDLLISEIEEHLTKKFKRDIIVTLYPKDSIQNFFGIIAGRTAISLSLNFSFKGFKDLEEVIKFSLDLVGEFKNYLKKKGKTFFSNDKEVIQKLDSKILRF